MYKAPQRRKKESKREKSSPTRRNKMEAVGDCHWRIDWIESQEDEIAPVIRPNLKILFFNLRFGMSSSEKKNVIFFYFIDHEQGHQRCSGYIWKYGNWYFLPLDSQTVSKIIGVILFGRTLSLIRFILNRLEIVHQLAGPGSDAVMRQPGWSVSAADPILVGLQHFVISYCKHQKKTNRSNQYVPLFSFSPSLTEFVLTHK